MELIFDDILTILDFSQFCSLDDDAATLAHSLEKLTGLFLVFLFIWAMTAD